MINTTAHHTKAHCTDESIAVIGLGYVGLPLAVALGRHYAHTIGFDIDRAKIEKIKRCEDPNSEGLEGALASTSTTFTADADDLLEKTFFIIGVPTPIDARKQPDLEPLRRACALVGPRLAPGAVVVFESTVYPGLTEEICGPLLSQHSGLICGTDFKLGYSPERINPGDAQHSLEKVVKIVAGQDAETLERVAAVYEAVVTVGVHRAPSIRVAEAAKVIENTQRDLNIALMNELAIIFDRLGISTREVLEAARTKWNFVPFTPGLVGGHCIGVDPYYLTTKAQEVGYNPQVILAGRRINDEMGKFIAQRLVKLLCNAGAPLLDAKVGVFGITFKENVKDVRNSRVPDIVNELKEFGLRTFVHDPLADPAHCWEEYGIELTPREELPILDALIYAVPHKELQGSGPVALLRHLRHKGIVIDVKSRLNPLEIPSEYLYWSL